MIVNGEEKIFEKKQTITSLLKELSIEPEKVVVEVNLNIVEKNSYETHELDDRDKIEIVGFIGGG